MSPGICRSTPTPRCIASALWRCTSSAHGARAIQKPRTKSSSHRPRKKSRSARFKAISHRVTVPQGPEGGVTAGRRGHLSGMDLQPLLPSQNSCVGDPRGPDTSHKLSLCRYVKLAAANPAATSTATRHHPVGREIASPSKPTGGACAPASIPRRGIHPRSRIAPPA